MKIDCNAESLSAIIQLQNDELLAIMIQDAEDFIFDNIDSEALSKKAFDNVKGLRIVRRLLEKILIDKE